MVRLVPFTLPCLVYAISPRAQVQPSPNAPALRVPGHDSSEKPPVSGFITKLWNMLNEPANWHLISWSDAGNTFVVLDSKRLAAEILPKYFKHNNFTSLVRQLNMCEQQCGASRLYGSAPGTLHHLDFGVALLV
jgi:hypothetical protein